MELSFMCAKLISTKEDVIAFWFDEISPEAWFKKDVEFDEMLKDRAGSIVRKALNGQLDNWSTSAEGAVGLVIVLDQFTRNIFRNKVDISPPPASTAYLMRCGAPTAGLFSLTAISG